MTLLLSLALAASPDALEAEARQAERAGDPNAEFLACEALVIEAPPNAASRQRCARRLDYLQARQDPNGGFSALSRLYALRRLPESEARAQAATLYAEPELAPALRRDLALWLALDAKANGGDPRPFLKDWPDAEPAQIAARDRLLLDPDDRESAASGDKSSTQHRLGVTLSAASLALFALVSCPLAWRARAERPKPYGLAILGLLCLGFASIAGQWEAQAGRAALALSPLLAGVHVLSLLALRTGRRAGLVRALAGAATLSASYLVLWRFELLDRVGL